MEKMRDRGASCSDRPRRVRGVDRRLIARRDPVSEGYQFSLPIARECCIAVRRHARGRDWVTGGDPALVSERQLHPQKADGPAAALIVRSVPRADTRVNRGHQLVSPMLAAISPMMSCGSSKPTDKRNRPGSMPAAAS